METAENVSELFLPEEARDPRIVERYHVTRVVGEGGMGRVFDATRRTDGRRVAIKVLHRELASHPFARHMMLREAHALAVAADPLVVEFLHYGETSCGLPYIVLEWLEGRTLHDRLCDEGPLPLPVVRRLFLRLLDALDTVHVRGIVHADLKPDNCMLVKAADGEEDLRLVDFGVCSIDRDVTVPAGEVYGTPGYLAPEVIQGGTLTPASDLYAAGVILFEMLTGVQPFQGQTFVETLAKQLHEPPPPPSTYRPGCGPALDALVARALSTSGEDRFKDASEMREAFLAALAAEHMPRLKRQRVSPVDSFYRQLAA
jgi:serine/threonine-protein kinase